MAGLEFVRTYLDNVLVLTTSTWDDHLCKLDMVSISHHTRQGLKSMQLNLPLVKHRLNIWASSLPDKALSPSLRKSRPFMQ